MTYIRLTKEFGFETSHALRNYDGLCQHIHGHSYRLFVTVGGVPKNDPAHPKNGMVMDFGELKTIVFEEIVSKFDHCLVINGIVSDEEREIFERATGRIIFTPYQPTCENMINDFANKIRIRLPEKIQLIKLVLYETPSSCAEWLAEENETEI